MTYRKQPSQLWTTKTFYKTWKPHRLGTHEFQTCEVKESDIERREDAGQNQNFYRESIQVRVLSARDISKNHMSIVDVTRIFELKKV